MAEDPVEQRILDAALSLFLSQGYSSTMGDQVSAAADVSVHVLHQYFPTKETAFCMVVDRESARIAAQVPTSWPPMHSALDAMRLGVDIYVGALTKSEIPELILLAHSERYKHPNLMSFFRTTDGQHQAQALIASMMAVQIEVGRFKAGDPQHMARQVIGMIHQAVLHEPSIIGKPLDDLDEYLESVCQLFVAGYAS
ncbi:MAG: TetR/AcrR family transcriptional regulator [Pseudomonadota bacterium]